MSFATSAAGAWVGAVGALSEGIAAKRAAQFNTYITQVNAQADKNAAEFSAAQDERNAVFDEQDASMAKASAAFNMQQRRMILAKAHGENRVAIGASGVTMEGSPLEALAENVYQGETEVLLEGFKGEMQARAYTEQAVMSRLSAEARRYEGRRSLLVGDAQAALLRFGAQQAVMGSYLKTAQIAISSAGSSVGQGIGGKAGGM